VKPGVENLVFKNLEDFKKVNNNYFLLKINTHKFNILNLIHDFSPLGSSNDFKLQNFSSTGHSEFEAFRLSTILIPERIVNLTFSSTPVDSQIISGAH
jgi:hypothetical protein